MKQAQPGDAVKVECSLDTGSETGGFLREKFQLQFTIGESRLIPGLEKAVIGMSPGESKTERIPVSDAFGERKSELILEVPRSKVLDGVDPTVGQEIELRLSGGETRPATVKEIREFDMLVDANHPLAGRDLVLDITFLDFDG